MHDQILLPVGPFSPPERGCSAMAPPTGPASPFSPPTRGWSVHDNSSRSWRHVLPAGRGGDPSTPSPRTWLTSFSPPEQECSGTAPFWRPFLRVLAAGAKMFRPRGWRHSGRGGSPRRSGGVPPLAASFARYCSFSLPERGCCGARSKPAARRPVLPADAGVVRPRTRASWPMPCAPRRRGDGPGRVAYGKAVPGVLPANAGVIRL